MYYHRVCLNKHRRNKDRSQLSCTGMLGCGLPLKTEAVKETMITNQREGWEVDVAA